jgi:type III restriction enzyme
MGLKLEKGLNHQTEAVNRINKVFENVHIFKNTYKYANPIVDLKSNNLLNNIKKLNSSIPTSLNGNIGVEDYLNIDIKMETGTGKTYVYTKTIFELNKNYGIHKFIILVPSLPIKLGTKNFINSFDSISHFKDQYDKSIDLYVLDAKKSNKKGRDNFPSPIRSFVESSELIKNRISVLLVNMQLFKDNSMLTKDYGTTVEDFSIPSEAINATRPFIIIDEPHRFSKSNKTFDFINNKIKPQCIIRFGATFPDIKVGREVKKDYHNLIYNLGSCDAFNQNLVKGVKVKYLESPDGNNAKIKVLDLNNKKTVKLELITETTKKTFELEKGDSLKQLDNSFENVYVDGIGKTLLLSNGQELNKGSEIYTDIYSTSYQTIMLEDALDAHFKTEKENFKRKDKIKTLALFFIDDIDSYRENKQNPQPTYLKDIFEKLLKKKITKELQNIDTNNDDELLYKMYLEATLEDISSCHGGYFSRDNNDSDENIAEEINQILVNKEETLSIYKNNGHFNTFRFIFSKWTLKEGWDNPNVFTIAKLRSSGSENSKIQEVGRGLRLPVNESLSRISNEQFYLNYIVDFTEKDFAKKLIQEINGDISENIIITDEQISNLANNLNKPINDVFIELLTKNYIDINKNIIVDNRDKLFSEYPSLTVGLKTNKIINANKKIEHKAKIRKDKFNEIKELWNILNKKYFISYSDIKDDEIINSLFNILKEGIEGTNQLVSYENTIHTDETGAYMVNEASVEYGVEEETIPYNVFLNKIYNSTSIPIKLIHKSLVLFNKEKHIEDSFFNNNTLINFICKINDWKHNTLFGKFKYTSSSIENEETALTNKDGSPKEYVSEGSLGVGFTENLNPSKNYLYDLCLYDSDLEKKNITTNNDEVIVFGKIPTRSVRIPVIDGATYSPDFMYVVKRDNDVKELNLVIETKDYKLESEIPSDQQFKIDCARKFFEQLKDDGYDVKFKVQINNTQISNLIKNL